MSIPTWTYPASPIIFFSGHRPDELGGYAQDNPIRQYIINEIEKLLKEVKPSVAISGMALGVDQWAAHVCIVLGIPYIAVIPFEGHESVWPQTSQIEYRRLLAYASQRVVVSSGGYAAAKMQTRNQWMVDHADLGIVVWNGITAGGTWNCLQYARSQKKPLVTIDPDSKKGNIWEAYLD